jgi:hypothetical protein
MADTKAFKVQQGRRHMRSHGLIAIVLGILVSSPALAQGWFEYVNQQERFAVSLPAQPSMAGSNFRSASGAFLPSKIFTTVNGDSTYMVTVVDYSGVDGEEYAGALEHGVAHVKDRDGELTSENDASYEGMDTRMLQFSNPDQTRSFVAVTLPPTVSHLERLYIVEGRSPEDAPPPGIFQQSLSFRDNDGVRLRYGTDIDGNKFRIMGDTCGYPYRRLGQEAVVLCDF